MFRKIYELRGEYKNTKIPIGESFEVYHPKVSFRTREKAHISRNLPAANAYDVLMGLYPTDHPSPARAFIFQAYFVPQLADKETQKNFYKYTKKLIRRVVSLEDKLRLERTKNTIEKK